ncbi:MAG: cytochrome c-type biogenesis protein [Hydrogenophaga sp.]|jgi:cytochrome c-type biogenesis protein CcmH
MLLSVCTGFAAAAIDAYPFDSPEKEAMFQRLSQELRCLVCQNQNLADSNAELAQDLRREIYRMVAAGQDERAVIDFMVARYGDFVLYRPAVNTTTYVLWIGPFALLVLGAATLLIMIRNRAAADGDRELSAEERQHLQSLLNTAREEGPHP